MRKKKGAAEFFELFKTRVKNAGVNIGVQAAPGRNATVADAACGVQSGLAEQPRPTTWSGPDNGKRLSEQDSVSVAPGMRVSMANDGEDVATLGERTFSLTVSTAALIVLLLISAAFAAFGFGFWFGKEAGRKEALEENAKIPSGGGEASIETAGFKPLLPTDRNPSVNPNTAKAGDPANVKKPSDIQRNPGPGVSKPVEPSPAKPTPPARFYSIRLIDWDIEDPDGKACAKGHVERLQKEGYDKASIRIVMRGGKRVLAVCYGQYETEEEGLRDLPRFQKMQRGYSSANVMLISDVR